MAFQAPSKAGESKGRIPVWVQETPYGVTTNNDHNLLSAQNPFVVCS